MSDPKRGEVWLADLGMAGKVRPVLVIGGPYGDQEYALVTVVPHTTSNRGARFEVHATIPFLQTGAFNVQGMLAVPAAKFIRRLGSLEANQVQQVEAAVKHWLGLA
jgi:mRNA interferase MazF